MKKTCNDNQNPWCSLAAATARALQPDEKQDEGAASDGDGGARDEQKRDADKKYVDQRLKDLRAFERRARGQR